MITPEERTELLRSEIERAKRLLRLAEAEMDNGVATLVPVRVGDKRTTTLALELSMDRVRSARKRVFDLESLLAATVAGVAR